MKVLLALLLAGKLGKVLITGGTMLVSVFAYAAIYGWAYGVGLVALIFVHEMGHYLAAKQSGLEVGAPVFIPFVGAWVALKDEDLPPEVEAYVGLAGPILGSIGAFCCYLLALVNEEKVWMAIAYSGFFINLFNLIPIGVLDGGRIVGAISPKLWLIGVPILAGAFLWKPSPMLLIIAILALPRVWSALKDPAAVRVIQSTRLKFQFATQYLVLVSLLAILAYEAHEKLTPG